LLSYTAGAPESAMLQQFKVFIERNSRLWLKL